MALEQQLSVETGDLCVCNVSEGVSAFQIPAVFSLQGGGGGW